jgi:hypothetical protein
MAGINLANEEVEGDAERVIRRGHLVRESYFGGSSRDLLGTGRPPRGSRKVRDGVGRQSGRVRDLVEVRAAARAEGGRCEGEAETVKSDDHRWPLPLLDYDRRQGSSKRKIRVTSR